MNPVSLEAMREELQKISMEQYTRGYAPHSEAPQQFETMTPAKWKQTAKDLPASILAGAAGYLVGRMGSEYIVPKLLDNPATNKAISQNLPVALGALSGATSMLMAHHRRILKGRRENAQSEAENAEVEKILKMKKQDSFRKSETMK